MAVRSTCRQCGAPLPKKTVSVHFGEQREWCDGHGWYHTTAKPMTRADVQQEVRRLWNEHRPLLYINRAGPAFGGHIQHATFWCDGAYLARHGAFCTNRCAGEFARYVVALEERGTLELPFGEPYK